MLFITGQQTVYAEATAMDVNKLDYQVGQIDRMRNNRVIIDDVEYKFTSQTLFLSKAGKAIESRWFSKGDLVKFYADNNRNLIVIRKP